MRTTNSERISSILFEPEHVMSDSIVAKSMLIAIQSMVKQRMKLLTSPDPFFVNRFKLENTHSLSFNEKVWRCKRLLLEVSM